MLKYSLIFWWFAEILEHFLSVSRVEQIVRDLCRTDKLCRGLTHHKHVDKSLILIMDTDRKKHKKDKGKKLSVGLRLILRPHTDESGSAGKKKKRISSVQSSRMLHRHVGNPLHHLASGQQKLNDWWRLCYMKTASLANTLKQLVCHVENHESHVLLVAVLDKHALCRSRPSKWCVQRNTPGLRFKPYPLYICFLW